jgi:hypothetical protein
MKQMDPEPGAATVSEMNRQRTPAQSSVLLSVTEKLPILQQKGETQSAAKKRAVHVFRKDQVLQPAPPYADYEDVPAAPTAGIRRRGSKRVLSPERVGDRKTGKVHTYVTALASSLFFLVVFGLSD